MTAPDYSPLLTVGEEVTFSGNDRVEHTGTVKRVEPSGTTFQRHTTGERIPGMKFVMRCTSCPKPHQRTATVPCRPWSQEQTP